jgi:predicted RNase H-like nuclease
MFIAGVDGCRAGWVAFKVELPSLATSVDVVGIAESLSRRADDLLCLAIDIPIGLIDGSRACDKAARKLLGQPRGSSVFAAPCRAVLSATTHAAASQINREKMGRGLTQDQTGGRCDHTRLSALGVRGSPGGLLLGAQQSPPNDEQQENK